MPIMNISLSKEEKQKFEEDAKFMEMSLSEFVRSIRRYWKKEKTKDIPLYRDAIVKMLLHSQGLCRHQGTDYLCFEYINKAEKNYLWFQQWSDTDFSLCVGEFDDEKSFEILGPTETPF